MVWETSPALTIASLAARLVKSLIPVAMLWVAKLILDRVARRSAVAYRLTPLKS